ncbi:o-succinylbenzoate synthase [Dysgonomonas sp. ZJ279]|uniref:o-succinylbenzoate synthase n=1 Tax=Dysgonomonas sp. ZJ279 TaxID=2709796 RepID=UPI0013ECCE31|nr:o-succinylbenzoate synthase [Dysgonomonas sp. ZJ279]
MELKIKIIPYTLQFKRPAGTSRGVYHNHKIWYVVISSMSDPERWGIGECAPLHDLSCDYDENYEQRLKSFCAKLEDTGQLDKEALRLYPSILFGLETAMLHYQKKSFKLWDTPYSNGEKGIPINGLIWMGEYKFMLEQIEAKMRQGFRCIKLKIGAINFEDELKLLQYIRKHFSSKDITLRVDANGAFSPNDAVDKLKRLADLDLHSIEQPIRAGQWDEMAKLVKETPLPIALDEELIGINQPEEKKKLLQAINPQYIILKPTLHGGISGATEWIELAKEMNIDWWITSALESNIGLNAIAQWCATFKNPLPQGLGTGGLYTNNIDLPLEIKKDCLWFNSNEVHFSLNDIL